MALSGQRKGGCGHIMANFDTHVCCARCREKGSGTDPCVQGKDDCAACLLLTPDQRKQLATPTYKLRKEKKSSGKPDVLIDPSQVSVVGPLDLNQSVAMGSNPSHPVSTSGIIAPVFSPVKVKVSHPLPTGVLSSSPFMPQTVSSPPPAGSAPGPGQESVMNVEAPVEIHQPETSGYRPTSDQPGSSASLPGPRGFSSPLENLYPDRSQDAEPTFGPPDREPVCYEDLPEDQASGSEADPQEKDRIFSEDQSYRETVRGVRAYMEWSFIPDKEFTAQSRHDNPWASTRSQPVGKISVAFPPEDWFCRKFEQMNLYIIDGHVLRSGERVWLRTDQFLKVPKTQNRWYSLHPAPNPVDNRPVKVVKFWSDDAPHLNSSFSRIAKPSGLTVTPPPSRPIAQDTLRKWDKALHEGTYVCNQAAGFNRCITKLQTDIKENVRALEAELTKGKSSQKADKALTEIRDLAAFNQNVSFCMGKAMQHLADIIFVQMGNITLLRWDAYLDHLKQGVKPDTWCALRNSPLNSSGLFPDDVVRRAEEEIAKADTERRATQPRLGHGGYGSKKQNRYQPYPGGWNRNQEPSRPTQAQDSEVPAWRSFGRNRNNRGRGRGAPSGGRNPKAFKQSNKK